jgi:FixJ family two-component response regulator
MLPPKRKANRLIASDNFFSSYSTSGEDEPEKNSLSKSPFISIVDDDESMREATESLIESLGFRVETFGSTEEFVQCDHLAQIACLILDVQLPGMSGLELQRLLSLATYTFPIIFITAHGDDQLRKQALKAGAVEFLNKPFSQVSLLTALDWALKR